MRGTIPLPGLSLLHLS